MLLLSDLGVVDEKVQMVDDRCGLATPKRRLQTRVGRLGAGGTISLAQEQRHATTW